MIHEITFKERGITTIDEIKSKSILEAIDLFYSVYGYREILNIKLKD